MPQLKIPSNKKFIGISDGEWFGNIYFSKNVDLERNKGKIVVGESVSSVFNSSQDGDLTYPVSFTRTAADGTDRWWALGGALFKTNSTNPESGWQQDAISSTPSPLYDMIEFVDDLMVAVDTNIYKLSGGVWTTNWWSAQSGASALTTGVPHRFAIFAGALSITDGRFINTWDGTLATDPALTLPSNMQSQWITPLADYEMIGTLSLDGNPAEVFLWDRVSSSFNARYAIGDTEALCGFVLAGIPHIITKRGNIKRFTGQGFRDVQQFPSVQAGQIITDINPNGVMVVGDQARILVSFGTQTGLRLCSGVWIYDVNGNLYHTSGVKNSVGSDYAQTEFANVGALRETSSTQGRYLLGAQVYTAYSGTTRHLIGTSDEDSTSNRGYFITPKLSSFGVRRFFKRVFLKYKNFEASSDRIRLAYRTTEDVNFPAYETITWATSTTFTATNANIAAGDFVEVIAGDNAGALAKISTYTGGTVTIDTTLNSSTSTARVRYLRFTDAGLLSTQGITESILRLTARGNWIQFLVELQGTETSPEFEEMLIDFENIPR